MAEFLFPTNTRLNKLKRGTVYIYNSRIGVLANIRTHTPYDWCIFHMHRDVDAILPWECNVLAQFHCVFEHHTSPFQLEEFRRHIEAIGQCCPNLIDICVSICEYTFFF